MENANYPRHADARLREALQDSPAVLIQGPRQCGKTTFARAVGEAAGYQYFTLDDEATRSFADDDPAGFVNSLPERVILDEAQLAPRIFPSLKLSIDRNRIAGRFILTGSVNLLKLSYIKESLAGRSDIIRLHPFSQCELERTAPKFLDALFSSNFDTNRKALADELLMDRVVAGGYPAALQRSKARRANWHQSYIQALLERDVPTIAEIYSLEALPQLLDLAAGHTAQLLSVDKITSSFQLNRQTIRRYLILLENMFLLERIPAWHSNQIKRLVKAPKLHFGDTGAACALLNLNAGAFLQDRSLFGPILETFVLQELKRQASAHTQPHIFHHFRDRYGTEVDIVIRRGTTALVGVEVKASGTVVHSDFKGLRKLKEATGKSFAGGVLLYDGDRVASFGEKMFALPVSLLWEAG